MTGLKDHTRKTSRAVILPFPGDPFLFEYWYKLFRNIWGKDVDKLYIYLNSPVEKPVVDHIRSLVHNDKKVNFTYNDLQIEHGEAINRTLDLVTEEYVMLVEDDCYIFGLGIISQCFNILESGKADIVGSKRGSCGFEILEGAREKWGLNYEGEGDQGCNFWPNLFFCKKELLLKTDRNFGAKLWKAGEKVPGLDIVVKEDQAGDTFVNTSLQLRAIVPEEKIHYIPQYHGHPLDIEHYEQRKYLFDRNAMWFHVGSLSSGIGGLIKDGQSRPLSRRLIDPPGEPTNLQPKPTNDFEKQEYERRVQWWDTFYWQSSPIGISEFKRLYKEGIDRIVEQFGLNRKRIERRKQIYNELINGNLPK